MPETLTAVYRDGAFVPEDAVGLPTGARVQLSIVSLPSETGGEKAAIDDFDALCDEVKVYSGKHISRDELHDRS